MLVNFSFRNYRSFADEQRFSMRRKGSPCNASAGWSYPEVSTVASIYGPNASGKSNMLDALHFVSCLARSSYANGANGGALFSEPFLLDSGALEVPSDFLVEFVASDGVRYVYSVAINQARVVEEQLVVYRTNQPTLLFERWIESGSQKMKFGPSFRGPKKQLQDITRENVLFLSVAAASGLDAVRCAYSELAGIAFYDAAAYFAEMANIKELYRTRSPRFEGLRELIRYADFGIEDMDIRRMDSDVSALDESATNDSNVLDGFADGAAQRKWIKSVDLFFRHRSADGPVWLSSDMESDGTIASLAFFSVALRALESGSIVLVDEMDRSLHPTLVKEFVALFADPKTNPRQAQLIFTTHDASLITVSATEERVVQRDQVWLVQKDDVGRSELVPLTDYSPTKTENLGRNYLNGVYHALPSPAFHERMAALVAPIEGGEGDA